MPSPGDRIYFELDMRITEVNSIDTEVHLHLFAAMPATPAEALSRSAVSDTALLGKVEAIDSAAGSAEVKADWFIEDPTKPQLKPTVHPFRPTLSPGKQQVRALVSKSLEAGFDYLFDAGKGNWKPTLSEEKIRDEETNVVWSAVTGLRAPPTLLHKTPPPPPPKPPPPPTVANPPPAEQPSSPSLSQQLRGGKRAPPSPPPPPPNQPTPPPQAQPAKRGRGEEALHRQSVRLRQFLQRRQRPCADVLDHFGRGERSQPAGIFMTGAAHQTEQKSGGEQIAGAGGIHHLLDRKCRHRDDAVCSRPPRNLSRCG